jgi:hypothetical protein
VNTKQTWMAAYNESTGASKTGFAVMGHAGRGPEAYVSVSPGHGGCAGGAPVVVDSEEGG